MAKARAIVKRRKAVRNIRKITKTMQMIATAKFQKSLKRAVGDQAVHAEGPRAGRASWRRSVGERRAPAAAAGRATEDATNRIAVVVITSNRGLAGAYNGSVLRDGQRVHPRAGGRRQDGRPVRRRQEGRQLLQLPEAADHAAGRRLRPAAVRRGRARWPTTLMHRFADGEVDARARRVHELHQHRRAEAGGDDAAAAGGRQGRRPSSIAQQVAEKEAQVAGRRARRQARAAPT